MKVVTAVSHPNVKCLLKAQSPLKTMGLIVWKRNLLKIKTEIFAVGSYLKKIKGKTFVECESIEEDFGGNQHGCWERDLLKIKSEIFAVGSYLKEKIKPLWNIKIWRCKT